MEIALRISLKFDKDQETVASDLDSAFEYKFVQLPSDWADSELSRHNY